MVGDNSTRRNVVLERVRAFATCGRSAQLLLLENGGWDKLNQWFRTGVACRDPLLLEEVLQVALQMPTGCHLLEKQGKGLPLSVENLVRRIHGGHAKEYGAEDRERLKALCLEVVVRWLKIRKLREEEDVGDRTEFAVEGGGMGALAKIENKPGWGFMAVNGKVKVVQVVDEDEEEREVKRDLGARVVVKEVRVQEEVKVVDTPPPMEVEILEEKMDRILIEVVKKEPEIEEEQSPETRSPSVTPMPSPSSSCFSVSPAPTPMPSPQLSYGGEEDEDNHMSPESPPEGEGMEEPEEDLDILVLQDDEETSRMLDEIDPLKDLGPCKKIIRWWGVDGVKAVHSYPPGEYHREGYVKENWMSISFSDDEEEGEIAEEEEENEWEKESPPASPTPATTSKTSPPPRPPSSLLEFNYTPRTPPPPPTKQPSPPEERSYTPPPLPTPVARTPRLRIAPPRDPSPPPKLQQQQAPTPPTATPVATPPPPRKTRWDPAPATPLPFLQPLKGEPRNWLEWKLRKIIAEAKQAHRFPVEAASRHPAHKIRPYAAEVRDTPLETETKDGGGDDKEKEEGELISTEDNKGDEGVKATEVYNWKQWPEPKPPRMHNHHWGNNKGGHHVNGGGGGRGGRGGRGGGRGGMNRRRNWEQEKRNQEMQRLWYQAQ